ncbi:MAG TPA: NAD(P)/FAD-dependent oxidoreductase [Hyphomicrobiaceae bacterium]|nr:NAD(P)/FAD-dependent oxidoreductase [Hyphomicrobiaceae bacterium]
MGEIWQGLSTERRPDRLEALAAEARRDLMRVNFPAARWTPEVAGPDGQPVLDALVVGAGLCGQTAAFAMMRDGIHHIRVVDRAGRGLEGPWATFARMEILRSPKHLTGPDLGIPSLTFRAWFEAQHGSEGWQKLHKVGRLDWRDYLLWVRDTVGIAVENGTSVLALQPRSNFVEVQLSKDGAGGTIFARKVVLATGRDGAGGARRLPFPGLGADANGGGRVLHAEEGIDGAQLAGKRVAILGGAATAFDCAATALEAGAESVAMFVRRPHLPQINKAKWMSFPAFMKGFSALDDATRWRFYKYFLHEQVPPPPHESVLRCDRHRNFSIRFGEAWRDVIPRGDGLVIRTSKVEESFDVAVLATGFDVDIRMRQELASVCDNILLWGDKVGPEEAARYPDAARFPYLGPGFELVEREPGQTPGLGRIHLFNWGNAVSHGALAGDIPGLLTGVNRLAEALCRDLLAADIARHWQAIQAYDDRELAPTRRFVER